MVDIPLFMLQKNCFESFCFSVDNNSGLFIPDLLRVCSSTFDLESFECNILLSLHELLQLFFPLLVPLL